MKNATVKIISKANLLTILDEWINQRPGLDPRDYGYEHDGWLNYRQESAKITQQRKDALTLLRAVEWRDSITADDLMDSFRAFSGRLQVKRNEAGDYYLDYCTGQYWPTEYRAAACAVLASALWDYIRSDVPEDTENKGDYIRSHFRRMFGKGIQSRWLD